MSSRSASPALVTNPSQKMNTKLGGTNNSLLSQEKAGYLPESSHHYRCGRHSPGARGQAPSLHRHLRRQPGLDALLGSTLPFGSRWKDSTATSRVEIIKDLKGTMKELLEAFLPGHQAQA
ncbi:hypothetical protein MRX96_009197 [Rhipicephalus microplus]